MQEVIVRSADGSDRRLVLLSAQNGIAIVCAKQRFHSSGHERAMEFAVGFPASEVRRADTGEPIDQFNELVEKASTP